MWHEAKKQEKLIRGMIVDYRRRAERRRDFYEKIKADPTQFLQLHGRPCKIHLDPAIAAAGDSSAIMMPWQGDHENVIDRFDVRAHLDFIPDIKTPDLTADDLSYEERNCNYERYRILAQNIFLGIGEEKFLHQLSVEEQFGVTLDEKELQKERQGEKKGTGAAIGYNYDESGTSSNNQDAAASSSSKTTTPADEDKDDSDEESDLEMVDVDLSIDVNKVEPAQAHAMNACGANYGMQGTDLFSFLTGDAQDAENQKQLLREEKEKALFSGRKSRRERRAHRDKKLALRVVSPPHYAAQPSPLGKRRHSPSVSPTRSISPAEPLSNAITFITSFGGEDETAVESDKPTVKASYADKARMNASSKEKTYATVVKDGSRRRTKRSPSPRRSDRSPYRSQRSPPNRSGGRPSSRPSAPHARKRSRSWRSRSADSRSKSRSRSRGRPFNTFKDKGRRSNSSKRSRRSGSSSSRSSYRSRSMDSQYSSASSRKRKYSHSAGNTGCNKDAGVGTSNSNQNSTSDRIPKYYGRKREGCRSSSSELSIDSSDGQSNGTDKTNDTLAGSKTSQVSNLVHNSGAASKLSKSAQEKLSIKERLRKKMQAQLSRQLRADKKAEAERVEREQQLLQERDDEMRELAIRLRRRQREMRHQRRASESSADRDSSSSHSPRDDRSRSPPLPPESSDVTAHQEGSETQPRTDKSKAPAWDQSRDNTGNIERSTSRDVESQRFSDANRYNRPPPFVIRSSFDTVNSADSRGSYSNSRYHNEGNRNTEYGPRGRSEDNRNNFNQNYHDSRDASNNRSDVRNYNRENNESPRFSDNRGSGYYNNRGSSGYNNNSRGSYVNSRYSVDNRGRGFNNNSGNRNYDSRPDKYQDSRKYDSNDSQDKYRRESNERRGRDNSDTQNQATSSSAKPFKRLVDY